MTVDDLAPCIVRLTHWGRATHICVSKLTIICSDNGLSPGQRQAIIWTKAGILLIGPLGTNFSEIIIEIITSSFKKMHFKLSSAKWPPFCLGLSVLTAMVLIVYDKQVLVLYLWQTISTSCAVSVMSSDRKCKYIFMFPQNYSVYKGFGLYCLWALVCCITRLLRRNVYLSSFSYCSARLEIQSISYLLYNSGRIQHSVFMWIGTGRFLGCPSWLLIWHGSCFVVFCCD